MCLMRAKLILISILLCFVFLAACKRQSDSLPSTPQATINQTTNLELIAENKLRQELGLRVIKGDWILYRDIGSQEDWKISKNGFPSKTVFKDSQGRISEEEDYYYSGNEFYDTEGHGWEFVTIHYNYGSKQVYLAYSGTNKTTEAILSKYFMTINGASSDAAGAVTTLRKVIIDWPDGPNK
jgi:hypothetical protein